MQFLENVPFPYNKGQETEVSLIITAMGESKVTEYLRWLATDHLEPIWLLDIEAEEIRAFLQEHIPLLESSISPAEHDAIVQPFLTIYERLSR